MANYNIVAESSFTPFTFEELLKPAMMASEAHLQMEKEYDTLQEQASTLEKLANQSRNTAEYNTYKQFSEDLKSQADALASQGLTQAGRQGIRNLRTKYREQLVPIQEAMQNIEKRAEEQRKLRASNPNLMFDRYFDSDVSIKDMMDNPNLSYSPVSGDDLYKKGIAAGKAASQRMFKDPVLKGQFYQIEQGYGKEAALQFLKDHSSIEELNESIKDIMSSSGANNLSEADITRATDFIVRGMFDGMDYDVKYEKNPNQGVSQAQQASLKAQGRDKEGNPIKDDPYWKMHGISFDNKGNPIVTGRPGVINDKQGNKQDNKQEEIISNENTQISEETEGVINKSQVNIPLGRYQKEWGAFGSDKPTIKGDVYSLQGNSKRANQYKAALSRALSKAEQEKTAIVLRFSEGDWGRRDFFKVGKMGEDVPDNWGSNFGDNISKAIENKVDIVLSKDYINQSESGYAEAGNYGLDNYILIRVNNDYIGIPKTYFSKGDLPSELISRYEGGW